MKFLKIVDHNGQVEIVNPRYIVKAFARKGGEGVRLVLAHRHEPLNAIEPTFEDIVAQLTGVPRQENEPV